MAGEFQAGDVVVPVAPSARDFIKDLRKEILPGAYKLGQEIGRDMNRGIKDALRGVYEPLREETKRQRRQAPRDGEETGGAFAQGFKKRLETAFKTLPKAEITADSSEAQQRVQQLRRQLEEMSQRTIGVDVDAATAVGELRALRAELDEVAATAELDVRADTVAASRQLDGLLTQIGEVDSTYAEVDVDADTAAARAQLTATEQQADQLDRKRVDIDVDVDAEDALAGLAMLGIAAAGIAAIPVGATLAAGLAGIAPAAVAATAALGGLALVAVPALSDIAEVMQLQEQAATGSEAAVEAYEAALAEMSPAARTLMGDWEDLTDEFGEWRSELEAPVLGLFSQGIGILSGRFQALTPLVEGTAGAVSGLLDRLDTALGSPFWTEFGNRVSEFAPQAVTSFGSIAGSIATGVAGIINALLPYAPQIMGVVEDIAAAFADWGVGLDGSDGLQGFFSYVAAVAPTVASAISTLVGAVSTLVQGLAPLGPLALGSFGLLLNVVSMLPPGAITGIAVAIGIVAAAVKGWQIAQLALNLALSLSPLQWIMLAIVALIGIVVWAYQEFDWFRAAVQTAWDGIKTAAQWAWDNVLRPIFDGLVSVIMDYVVPAVLWLWHNVFVPAWDAIAAAISWAWNNVLRPIFDGISWLVENVLAPVFTWLYENVIRPVWAAISLAIDIAWGMIKIVFAAVRWYITNVLGPVFTWIYETIIKPVWDGIKTAINTVWTFLRDRVFTPIWNFLRNTLGPVFSWLYTNVIKPVWDGIKTAINAAWQFIRDKVFSPVRTGIGKVGDAFDTAKKAIEKAWQGIQKAARAPVRFLVETVYMGGIKPMWDKVADLVGADKLPKVTLPRGFARGGILPGKSNWWHGDSMLAPVRPGEGWYVSEAMRDPYERARLYAINRAAIRGQSLDRTRARLGEGFARGGIVAPDTSSVRMPNVWDLLVDLATKGAAAFAGVGTWGAALDVVVKPLRSALSTLGTRGLPGVPYMTVGAIRNKLVEWLDGNAIGGVGSMLPVGSTRGTPGRVVALARAAVGRFPENPPGSNRNAITSWYGLHDQWCAMFISWLFAQAGASGSLGRARRTAWTGDYYTSGMPRVYSRQPGDILVYGTRHVNLSLGGRETIGGNESNNVRYNPSYPGTPAIFRPFWKSSAAGTGAGRRLAGLARGGVVPRRMLTTPMLRRIGDQDDRRGSIIGGYASGTWSARPGLAWVGEQGPELVAFRGGETVIPHDASRALAAVLGLSSPSAGTTVSPYRGVGAVESRLRTADVPPGGQRAGHVFNLYEVRDGRDTARRVITAMDDWEALHPTR